MVEYKDRLAKAMAVAKVKTQALADALGISYQAVKKVLDGKSAAFDTVNNSKAAKFLGISSDWLAREEGAMVVDAGDHKPVTNVETAPPLRQFRDVPVVGTVQGGDKGYLLELEHAPGHGDGAISYPARDQQSYAVRVRGDSMRPRIKVGEFIVVEPNHECQPGDDVVVILKDGQRMVKELLYIREGEVTFGSINDGHANITVTMDEIEKMHYVAAIIPRGAFYKA